MSTGDKSAIEWTDSTWNPTTGCSKISPGCDNCYAEAYAIRLQKMGSPRYVNGFEFAFHDDALALPLTWKKSRMIFVDSMSDLFHERNPVQFIDKVFEVIRAAPRHTYQILTKRSYLMMKYSERIGGFPNQVWAGVSLENAQYQFRIDHLRGVRASVRFLSIEPLLGPVGRLDLSDIHWVIAGGESGPNFRTLNPDWVREIRDQCIDEGVPFFFKQWGGKTPKSGGRILDGKIWHQFPRTGAVNTHRSSSTLSEPVVLRPQSFSKDERMVNLEV